MHSNEKPGPRGAISDVAVAAIRPEEGLGRKRDRQGHEELQRSIAKFGVLTPVTVRRAPDSAHEYLLIKGQGRTLACRLLGMATIPAIVVDEGFAEREKVRQFLVENVARLKMRPIDRALLVHRARQDGEESTEVARRFGITTATVRRLWAQLDGATSGEVAALRRGSVSLSTHGVVAKFVQPEERGDALDVLGPLNLTSKEAESLFRAIGWAALSGLGNDYRGQRLRILRWSASIVASSRHMSIDKRIETVALSLPKRLDALGEAKFGVPR